jgi:hypothetical protein
MELARSAGPARRPEGEQMEPVTAVVREMEAAQDLDGLAAVALMALFRLRRQCERPTTCAELDSILARLEGLRPHLKMPED